MATSLTAGRDLLQTHFAAGPGGAREVRSHWALAVSSPPVTRALLAELGQLASLIAAGCADLAQGPGPRGTAAARRSLNAACYWLQTVSASAQTAQRHDPVLPSDHELLHAIPVNAAPPRMVPQGSEPVSGLCYGMITSAERVRHAAWAAGMQAALSPRITVESLRHAAATSTLTSHHCELLLRSLAARTPGWQDGELSAGLLRAAEAAGRARAGWLRAAQALGQVTTDTPRRRPYHVPELGDLALWTGRLAYADPGWTLSAGAGWEPRPPRELAPGPGDVRAAVAAVHHACDAVTSLAYAERERFRTAAGAGRVLVPTRTLPGAMDVPRPFAPALPNRVHALLACYEDAARAGGEATAGAATAAEFVRAPSRVLTAARAAVEAGRTGNSGRAPRAEREAVLENESADRPPGPAEGMLRRLGVTSPDLLQRGAELDQTGERLIIEAAEGRAPQRGRAPVGAQSKSSGVRVLAGHGPASASPHARGVGHPQAVAERVEPEAEP